MTDHISALTVVLKPGIHEDLAKPLISAIRMLKGVVSVDTHVDDIDAHMAKMQLAHEWHGKLQEVMRDLLWGKK